MISARKLLFVLVLAVSLIAGTGYAADSYRYATTNMTWAEFYAGETGATSSDLLSKGLDAISTPTVNGISRFPLLWSESNDAGSRFYGEKSVQVRMTEDVYNSLSDTSRYTLSDTAFTEYKDVNADGTFGRMVTSTDKPSGATVTMSTGSSARWGHYVLSVSGVSIDIGTSGDKTARNYLGALIETSDGKTYGMRHDNNLWSNTDIAFTVNENYTEPHGTGVTRFYDYTAELEGKTIRKITYMLKGLPDIVIDSLDIYVKKQSPVSVSAGSETVTLVSGSGARLNITFDALPTGVTYTLSSLTNGSGRNSARVDSRYYTYADGVLTLSDDLVSGTYTATFSTEKYTDISTTFTVSGMYRYATTDMTWAEFYAGELGAASSDLLSSGLDAVSSPTARIAGNMTQLSSVTVSADAGALVSSDEGNVTRITGVKAVQVRMTESRYNTVSRDSRYTFSLAPYVEYKDLNADGSFGKMATATTTLSGAVVGLSGGVSSTWGNYTLNITSADINPSNAAYLGAIITTSDDKSYALRHNTNLWFQPGTIAFSIKDFVEAHGIHRDYAYTSDLEGKTITSIRWLLKDVPDPIVNCSVYVQNQTTAAVEPSGGYVAAGKNVPVKMIFRNVPQGASYGEVSAVTYADPSARHGWSTMASGNYTYSDGIFTISGDISSGDNYRVTFKDTSGKYVDIRADFKVYTARYATTDMTWAEFYAGETGKSPSTLLSSGLDAISTPTVNAITRFPLLVSSSSDVGSTISGVKAVQVRMREDVYNAISDKSRYAFVSNANFAEFKEVSADGTFGAMSTETVEPEGATVRISSGSSATWGHYVLSVSGASIDIGTSNDKIARNYLGGLIETSSGDVYGMRHDNNLWSNTDMAFTVNDDYTEPHGRGVRRFPEYTSSLEGKTIRKITYMLKDIPDVVIDSLDLFVKYYTSASVKPKSYDVQPGSNVPITLEFSNVPSDARYSLVSLQKGSGRSAVTLSNDAYTYSGNVLTISGYMSMGDTYTAKFEDTSGKYFDIRADINVYTTNATSQIITSANNSADLTFLLTPRGAVEETDNVLSANNFVNATEYTRPSENYSVLRNVAEGINGSGFSFDVKLNNVPSGKRGILGFSNTLMMTSSNVSSSRLATLRSAISALPDVAYGWRVPTGTQLHGMGLTVVGIYPDGVSRDITDYVSSGLLISGDSVIMSYGTVMIDRVFTPSEEGKVYALSEEGEGTMSDGAYDGHISAAWYVKLTEASSTSGGGSTSGNSGNESGNSGGSTGGTEGESGNTTNDTPVVVPKSVQTEAPSTAIMGNEATKTAIAGIIRQKNSSIPADVAVIALPSSTRASRSVSSLSTEQRNAIEASSQDIAAVLPVISVDVAAVYVFGVTLDMLSPDMPIFLHLLVSRIGGGSAEVSAADGEDTSEAYTFTDDSGTTVTTVPSNQHVNVAAYMEPGNEYSPVITTASTGSDGSGNVGDSGGGCNTASAVIPAVLLGILLALKKK